MSGFQRRGEVITCLLSEAEASVLVQLADELLSLLGQADDHDDPLAAAVGISTNDRLPTDPALARLLPDAYGDPEHAGEFRRYTEHGLRAGKRQRLDELRSQLQNSGSFKCDSDTAQRIAMALNDLRLFLGTRLDVGTESEDDFDRLDDADPRKAGLAVYSWLGWLQQTLVDALL